MALADVTLLSNRALTLTDIYGNFVPLEPGQTKPAELSLTNRVIASLIHVGAIVVDGVGPNDQIILDTINNIRQTGSTGGGGTGSADLTALQAAIEEKTTLSAAEASFSASLAAHAAGDASDAELAAEVSALQAAIGGVSTDLADGLAAATQALTDHEAGDASDAELAAAIAGVTASIAAAQTQADQRAADEQAQHDDQAALIAALRADVDAIMIPDPLFKGEIAGGDYDFSAFPAPTTGNDFIDGGGAVEAGTNFIATGDGSFILLPVGGGAFLTYDFTEGDKITVTQDAASFSVAVLNVNADTGGNATSTSTIETTERFDFIDEGFVSTATFANFGTADPALTDVSDGDRVVIMHTNNIAQIGVFIDGVANVGRVNSVGNEVRVEDGGQVQVRFLTSQSGIDSITIFRDVPLTTDVNRRELLGSFDGVVNNDEIDIGRNWGDLEEEFEQVEFQIVPNNTIPIRNSVTVSAENWTGSVRVSFFDDGSIRARLSDMLPGTSIARFIENQTAFDNVNIRVYGIRRQLVNLPAANVPVVALAKLSLSESSGTYNEAITGSKTFGGIPQTAADLTATLPATQLWDRWTDASKTTDSKDFTITDDTITFNRDMSDVLIDLQVNGENEAGESYVMMQLVFDQAASPTRVAYQDPGSDDDIAEVNLRWRGDVTAGQQMDVRFGSSSTGAANQVTINQISLDIREGATHSVLTPTEATYGLSLIDAATARGFIDTTNTTLAESGSNAVFISDPLLLEEVATPGGLTKVTLSGRFSYYHEDDDVNFDLPSGTFGTILTTHAQREQGEDYTSPMGIRKSGNDRVIFERDNGVDIDHRVSFTIVGYRQA